jgi:hypothetical protein
MNAVDAGRSVCYSSANEGGTSEPIRVLKPLGSIWTETETRFKTNRLSARVTNPPIPVGDGEDDSPEHARRR